MAYLGISWGAITGITYAAHDPRMKVVVSLVGGGNFLGWFPGQLPEIEWLGLQHQITVGPSDGAAGSGAGGGGGLGSTGAPSTQAQPMLAPHLAARQPIAEDEQGNQRQEPAGEIRIHRRAQ
jgi:hypothetical protein